MKKILILGDSVSIGYRAFVEKAFEGVAEVRYQNENGRFAAYMLRKLWDWKTELGWGDDIDLIHWNAGLWDDLVLPDGRVQTPIDRYEDDIDRIAVTLRMLFPRAKLVFATSTPVLEDGYAERFPYYRRYNKDTEAYNAAAVRAVMRHGGEIDDLYSLLSDVPAGYHSDMTHFNTREATEIFANKVISCIETALEIKAVPLDYDALFAEGMKNVGI